MLNRNKASQKYVGGMQGLSRKLHVHVHCISQILMTKMSICHYYNILLRLNMFHNTVLMTVTGYPKTILRVDFLYWLRQLGSTGKENNHALGTANQIKSLLMSIARLNLAERKHNTKLLVKFSTNHMPTVTMQLQGTWCQECLY